MNPLMTAPARRELVEALRQRYAAATREEKVRILTEFAAVSGLHRKSAIRVLNAEAEIAPWRWVLIVVRQSGVLSTAYPAAGLTRLGHQSS